MKIDEMIRRIQRELDVAVDGKAGPETWGAIYQRIVRPDLDPQLAFVGRGDRANERSERQIATLLPTVKPFARALFFKALEHGIQINVLSGFRSFEEQDALYAQGRGGVRGEQIVTNARGGQSIHNFGIAFDIGVFEGSRYLRDSPKYKAVGVLGEDLGLEWGGNWTSLVDQSHFQMRPAWSKGMSNRNVLAELRRRKARGEPFLA